MDSNTQQWFPTTILQTIVFHHAQCFPSAMPQTGNASYTLVLLHVYVSNHECCPFSFQMPFFFQIPVFKWPQLNHQASHCSTSIFKSYLSYQIIPGLLFQRKVSVLFTKWGHTLLSWSNSLNN